MKRNVGEYDKKLKTAKKKFEKSLKTAIQRNQERYRENDEKIKTTLKALKYSSLGLWDVEYLLANIKVGIIIPEIGVPVDRQNYDIATQNF